MVLSHRDDWGAAGDRLGLGTSLRPIPASGSGTTARQPLHPRPPPEHAIPARGSSRVRGAPGEGWTSDLAARTRRDSVARMARRRLLVCAMLSRMPRVALHHDRRRRTGSGGSFMAEEERDSVTDWIASLKAGDAD